VKLNGKGSPAAVQGIEKTSIQCPSLPDSGNEILHIMDRVLGSILTEFGAPGLQAGQFTFLHSVVLDSKGNLYTGETINGRRVQKFTHIACNNGNGQGNGNGNCS